MTMISFRLAVAIVGLAGIFGCRGVESARPVSEEVVRLSPVIGIEECRARFRSRLKASLATAAGKSSPNEKVDGLFLGLPESDKAVFIEAATILRRLEQDDAIGPEERRRLIITFVDDSFEAQDICPGREPQSRADMYAFASAIMAALAADGSSFPDGVLIGDKFDEPDEPALRLILALVIKAYRELAI